MSIDGWLAQKYAILAQQADTARIEGVAKAGYYGQAGAAQGMDAAARMADVTGQNTLRGIQGDAMRVNTSLAPGESSARIAGVNASADQTRAQTAETLANTRIMDQPGGGAGLYGQFLGYMPRKVMSDTAPYVGGGAGVLGNPGPVGRPGATTSVGSSVITPSTPASAFDPTAPLPPGWSRPDLDPSRRYSKGTSKVPGKGDGKTDTVAAKLAPGEAVLNKAAAEHLGRDTIDLLNAVGQAKMGLGMTPTQKAETAASDAPGFAAGTSSIGGLIPGTAPGLRSTELAAMPGVANGLQAWAPAAHGLVPVAMPAAPQPQLVAMVAPQGLVGYAAGTSNVGKAGKGAAKSAAATAKSKPAAKSAPASKGKGPTITPQLVQALMQMGGQAGMM